VSTRLEERARLRALYRTAPRDVYFDVVRSEIARYYLADLSNPYQQSGRSNGAERWRETRHCILQAVHRDGDFLDVGCANGLLLESLIGWAAERGIARQFSAVAEGGRLIVCHYREAEDAVDVDALLSGLGYTVKWHTEAPGVTVTWCERSGR